MFRYMPPCSLELSAPTPHSPELPASLDLYKLLTYVWISISLSTPPKAVFFGCQWRFSILNSLNSSLRLFPLKSNLLVASASCLSVVCCAMPPCRNRHSDGGRRLVLLLQGCLKLVNVRVTAKKTLNKS